ncbi:hypothetical protein Rs2_40618 [Raphanus sativus]|nr:hypothetical protein Rs2_40618 [Raphanus sativus]
MVLDSRKPNITGLVVSFDFTEPKCKNVPSVLDGDDTGFICSDAEKDGLSQIEVMLGRIAPTCGVAGLSKVWRTKVCSCDGECSPETPFWVIDTFDLEISAVALAAV